MSSQQPHVASGNAVNPLPYWDDPRAVIESVQQRVLRGMLWPMAVYGVLQLVLWHTRPAGSRVPVSYVFEVLMVGGLLAQFLGLRYLSIRGNGILFVLWLGLIDLLIWTTSGPEMSGAIAMICTLLAALFFINKRAGAAVILGFGAWIVLHALLVVRGLLPVYSSYGTREVTLVLLLRTGLYAFGIYAVCYAIFALIHHVLFQTLARVTEERRRRAEAEAAHRKAEETMLANQHFEALGKLASGVAHDVNNALTAVLGNAELLRFSLPPGEEQVFAQDILKAAESAAHTTRQLLNLNRQAVCQPVSTDPVAIVTTVSRLVGRLMPDNVRLQLDCRSRQRILVDPADLQQALLNLLLNARDALPAGGQIILRSEDRPGAGVAVSVCDNGRGIPADVLPRIFEPFFTTKAVGQGTGLGLAMVKTFVEEAGGQVTAANLPGGGACLELVFPPCHEAGEAAPRRARPEVQGQRILLVEEDEGVRTLLERVLRRGGHHVTVAANPAAARTTIQTAGPFAVLCSDLFSDEAQMAGLIADYKAANPDTPVLLCTGRADPMLSAGGRLSHSGVELIRKPFTGTELLARLQRILTASRSPGG